MRFILVSDNQLDLDSVQIPASDIVSAQNANSALWGPVLFIALMLAIVIVATVWGRRTPNQPARLKLHEAPLAAKLTWSFMLVIYSIVHVLAAVTVYLETRVVYTSTVEYFQFLKAARLTALSHAHLMAITTMDVFVALLFSFSRSENRSPSGFAAGLVTATFIGIVCDIGTWWMIKYWGESYELVSIVAGTFFAGGFAIMMLILLYDTWLRRDVKHTGVES